MIFILNQYIKIIKIGSKKYVLYNPFKQSVVVIDNKEKTILERGVDSENCKLDLKILKEDEFILPMDTDYANYYINQKNHILKNSGIHVLYLQLQSKCNLSCKYCFVKHNFTGNSISKENISRAIELFKNQYTPYKKTIILYGGEPLLNKGLLTYAIVKSKEQFKDNLNLSIITNGILITKELLDLFKKYNVSIGLSLDGFEEKSNINRVYKNNLSAHKEIMKAYNLLKSENVPFSVSYTISKDNIKNIEEFTKKLKGPRGWSFNLLLNKNMIYPKDFSKRLMKISKMLLSKGIVEDRFYGRRISIFAKKGFYVKDCAGMGNQIVVTPEGRIGICHGYDWDHKYFFKYQLNNFDLKTDLTKLDPWKTWTMRTPLNMPKCQNCIAITLCGGGCAATPNKGKYLNIYNIDKNHCKIYKNFVKDFMKEIGLSTCIK